MKRILMVILMIAIISGIVFAQRGGTVYVSARGNDSNPGTETQPYLTLGYAITMLTLTNMRGQNINTITIIGTLDERSDPRPPDGNNIFQLFNIDEEQEIIITGKPGATGAERAVLSGSGPGKDVVVVALGRIRFEHIEISGGRLGITIADSRVTLGPGAVIKSNSSYGVGVMSAIVGGTLVIDGGEVRDNAETGIILNSNCTLTLRNGVIRDNSSTQDAGGVQVNTGATFTILGGSITGNRTAGSGGGVHVQSGGTFNQTGGTISNNTAAQSPNIHRAQGSLGTNR